MTDRELLELAAKAAGFTNLIHWVDENTDEDSHLYGFPCLCRDLCGKPYEIRAWNPLVDDSDALRLACGQSADIFINQATVRVEIGRVIVKQEIVKGDKVTAVRRAIVRAVAEIGKNMKEG